MGAPATQGKLCTRLEDMEIGDYIRCTYTATQANVAGEFSDLGGFVDSYEAEQQQVDAEGNAVVDADGNPVMEKVVKQYEELVATPGSTAKGYFYLLKVDRGLLLADRRVQAAISASSLNAKNYLCGKKENNTFIRILSVDEWVKYITNGTCDGNTALRDPAVWNIPASHSTYGNIGDPWNYTNYTELIQTGSGSSVRTELSMGRMTFDGSHHFRYYRAHPNHSSYVGIYVNFTATQNPYSRATELGPYCYVYICFRPALEYIDNPNSKTVFY